MSRNRLVCVYIYTQCIYAVHVCVCVCVYTKYIYVVHLYVCVYIHMYYVTLTFIQYTCVCSHVCVHI